MFSFDFLKALLTQYFAKICYILIILIFKASVLINYSKITSNVFCCATHLQNRNMDVKNLNTVTFTTLVELIDNK